MNWPDSQIQQDEAEAAGMIRSSGLACNATVNMMSDWSVLHLEQPDLAGSYGISGQAQALQSSLDGRPVLRACSAHTRRGRQTCR